MVDYFTRKEQIVILIIVLLVLGGIGFTIFFQKDNLKDEESLQDLASLEDIEKDNLSNKEKEIIGDEKNINNDIMVDVGGQVSRPGLIKLKEGDRLVDAVEAAGGLKEEADLDRINLARKLNDEEKIYIPRIGEEDIPKIIDSNPGSDNNTNNKSKININTADKEELMTLPGIGEATADKILNYREENSFEKIEDIMNVSGIGDKKFEDIKDMISTN